MYQNYKMRQTMAKGRLKNCMFQTAFAIQILGQTKYFRTERILSSENKKA